jgi:hypothetical protein
MISAQTIDRAARRINGSRLAPKRTSAGEATTSWDMPAGEAVS